MDSQPLSPDPIADSLGLEPLRGVVIQKNTTPINVEDNDIDADFSYARDNLINTIEKGNEALNSILEVAVISQQPRAFEVVATLIKTMADTNKNLLELRQQKKDIKGESDAGPKTINNNLFVGSTSELQKMLKGEKIDGSEGG